MFNIKNKIFKRANKKVNKIIKEGGGATYKNRVLINYILTYLKNNDMTPEELKKEIKEGKGKFILKMVTKGKSIDEFLDNLFLEIKKEYYKK